MKFKINKKGITLLEIIITIAILAIVIPLAFSILGFGNRTFQSGISKRDIQQNVRNISTVITDEIRYAESGVTLLEDEYTKVGGETYIELDSDGLKKYEGDKLTFQLGDDDEINFSGSKIEVSGNVIKVTIQGSSDGNDYKVTTSVVPLNGTITGSGSGHLVRIK